MFGGFGSRFAKFGTGGGGRSIASPADLLQLFKRGSEDGAMIDELDNTTDLELANVNCLSFDGINDYIDFNHTLVDQQDFVVEWEGIMGAVSNNDAFWSLFDDSGSNRGSYIRYEHTNTRVLARIGASTIFSSSITLAENDVLKLTTTISNSGTKASAVIVVNGVTTNLFTNQTLNTVPEFDGTGRIGRLTPLSTSKFKGKVSSFKITQGEVNVHFPLAEGSGTTVYDVSGNGNHGIINGATWSTADSIESWNHEYGFDIDGAVKVPALNTKTKQVAAFDGAADYVNTNTPNTFKGSYEVTFVPAIVNNTMIMAGGRPSTSRRTYIAVDAESVAPKLSAGIGDRANNNFRGTTTLTLGTRYRAKLTWDDATNNAELFLDQFDGNGFVSEATISYGSTASDADIIVGAFNNSGSISNHFNGEIHSFIFKDGSDNTVIEYDFQNDIGTDSIVDISGNGNDGDLTYGSGALETFWGTRVADASGSLVSADYATGNTSISNPPALDNDSEVDLVQTDSVFTSGTASLWSADGSAQDEKTFAQLIDHAANRNGYHRVWVKVVNGRVVTIAQYNLDKDFLPSDVLKNERYFGGTSGALRDVNGDFILDSSGFVLFAG